MTTAHHAYQAFTEHPRFKYRGCAPDIDQPTRAAGNIDLPVDAWAAPDLDGAEDQIERRAREEAAIEVCIDCPVMVLCLTYAMSTRPDGRIAEPYGIFGGTRQLERHREFIRTRLEEDADKRMRTPQKQAVLNALAAHEDPELIAAAAGLDVRTANWQRSAMATLLGLNKDTATRGQILAEARRRGLLTPQPAPAVAAAPAPVTAAVTAAADQEQEEGNGPEPVRHPRIPTPQRRRFTHITGQLDLDTALADHHPRPHLHLVPQAPAPVLEAAA